MRGENHCFLFSAWANHPAAVHPSSGKMSASDTFTCLFGPFFFSVRAPSCCYLLFQKLPLHPAEVPDCKSPTSHNKVVVDEATQPQHLTRHHRIWLLQLCCTFCMRRLLKPDWCLEIRIKRLSFCQTKAGTGVARCVLYYSVFVQFPCMSAQRWRLVVLYLWPWRGRTEFRKQGRFRKMV